MHGWTDEMSIAACAKKAILSDKDTKNMGIIQCKSGVMQSAWETLIGNTVYSHWAMFLSISTSYTYDG